MYSKSYKFLSIVLKSNTFGENSKLITLFTKERGKIKVISRGSRKIKSKIGGRIEPFNTGVFYVVKGKENYTLTTVDISNNFICIREDLLKLKYAFNLLDIVDKFTLEEDVHKELFELLYNSLKTLSEVDSVANMVKYGTQNIEHKKSRSQGVRESGSQEINKTLKPLSPRPLAPLNLDILLLYFIFHSLKYIGYELRTDICGFCKKIIYKANNLNESQGFFDIYSGKFVCEDCNSNYFGKFEKEELFLLNNLNNKNLAELLNIKLGDKVNLLKVNNNLLYYLENLANRRLFKVSSL